MNYYQNFNNPYYMQQPMQRMQPQMQPDMQYSQPQPIFRQQQGLQGKSVDNVEVVKATDIPLDGSISYFPLTDGSAIVTKQLQQDGTSKTIIYRPSDEKEEKVSKKYITADELEEALKKIENSNTYKDDIKAIKRQIKDLVADIDEIKDRKD